MSTLFKGMILLIALAAISASANAKAKSPKNKPNIILIMCDDLGWGDTGYNGNTIIKTPNLDKMASEGVQFNRFYSASAVCSPTRASVLTGRNPFRTGVFYANTGILRPEEVTLPELLKEEGYTTGHFGKWHLGTLTHTEKDANRGKPGNTKEYNPPAEHGYDDAFVTESKVPTYDPMKRPAGKKARFWDYIKEGEPYEEYGTYYWNIKGEKVSDNLDGDDSRVIMDRVIPFIDRAVKNEQPFLSVVWFHTPHLPCVAGPKYQEMYKDQDLNMRNYAGCITAMDEQVGRLRAFLKEQGVDENTMIWFCSDNGPENGTPGITGGHLGRKRSLHDGGIRVPGLLVWPEKVKTAMKTDIPCVTSDYLPTIMDVLDIDSKKAPYELDGTSLVPLMEGKMKKRTQGIGFCIRNQAGWITNNLKLYGNNGEYVWYNMQTDEAEANGKTVGKELENMKKHYNKFYQSCKESFEGKEYGTKSCERLPQKWVIQENTTK